MQKRFIAEQDLLEDSYRLAVQIFDSGFRPDFIVGVWRGGSTVGIYVQECLQYLGVETDHIAIRTSYRGRDDEIGPKAAVEDPYRQTVGILEQILLFDKAFLHRLSDLLPACDNLAKPINRPRLMHAR